MYELQWLIERLLKRAASVWDAFRLRLPKLPGKWLLLLSLGVLVIYAFLLRCLHLLSSGHYYLISPDSYFFHWLAGKVMAGEELPAGASPGAITGILHSGLTYPLAYIAKAASYVFGLSSADALDLVCKLLPPVLGIIGMVVIYLAASRIYNRRAGLFAALAWAIIGFGVVASAAGYVDRDSLSILLVTTGALVFYFSRDWQFRIGNRDVGWLVAGLGVLAIEGILYAEWSFVGPILLLAIIIAYSAVRFLLGYFDELDKEPNVLRRIATAARKIGWRTVAVIILGHAIFAGVNTDMVVSSWNFATAVARWVGQSDIAEMQGITLWDILSFGFLLIPMVAALLLAWRRRDEGAIFASCWFLCLLVLSLFAKRVLLHAAVPACLLSGIGLAFLWEWMKQGQYQPLKKAGVAALLCLLVLLSLSAYSVSSNPRVAVNEEWQDALTYLRDSTPQDSVVMTWWDYGYWILDLGQRRPVVDNGFYGWDWERLQDTAVVYTTTDPSEAAQIMEKYGADYLVFSTVDKDIASVILKRAGLEEEYKGLIGFPPDSLVSRVLDGEFDSEDGLKVVYRSAPDSEVFILGLVQSE